MIVKGRKYRKRRRRRGIRKGEEKEGRGEAKWEYVMRLRLDGVREEAAR